MSDAAAAVQFKACRYIFIGRLSLFFNIDIYDKLIILNKILNGYGYMTKISTEKFFTQ